MKRREFVSGLVATAAFPMAARAQQAALPVIGFLSGGSELGSRMLTAAFRRGLGEFGYVEGRNVEISYRWAETRYDRLPELGLDLVAQRVALIVATGGAPVAQAAKLATKTIPIVFTSGSDPVEIGIVPNLNHPGGNVTGVSIIAQEIVGKRLELLHEIVPSAKSIGLLVNPTSSTVEAEKKEAEIAARLLGVRLVILDVSTLPEIEVALEMISSNGLGAFLTDSDRLFFEYDAQLTALAARYRVPAIYATRIDETNGGGLVSYGASLSDAYRLVGTYAGRILRGERPGDLPVQQSTKVELIINMQTAKALGLTFPLALLGRADEVIE
jgi:putative tryptophan/tyrosine transport system substrate-binding protein